MAGPLGNQPLPAIANTTTTASEYLSAVACNARGDFVVAWTDSGEDLSYSGVYAKFFLADGFAAAIFIKFQRIMRRCLFFRRGK